MTKAEEKGSFEPQYLEVKFKTKLMNKRVKGQGGVATLMKSSNRLPLYQLFKESAVHSLICEDIMLYIGSKGVKGKNKPNLPTNKSNNKDITVIEEEVRTKPLKDQIIASLILILTANDLSSILNSLTMIKSQLSNSS